MSKLLQRFVCALLCFSIGFPAWAATTLADHSVYWRVRSDSTAATAAGAGFVPTAVAGMLTDGAATVATGTACVFTSATYTFVAGDAGAKLFIAPTTGWISGWYPISSVSGGAATLDSSQANIVPWRTQVTGNGCATTGSPTGATFTVDYSDLASPKLAITDLASTASTTIATSNLTPVMVGNVVQLASATGGTPTVDYYILKTYVNSTAGTFDRPSGTYTGGVAKLGGALGHPFKPFCTSTGATWTLPATPSPLLTGHTVWIWGNGGMHPSSVQYNVADGWCVLPQGDGTQGSSNGNIRFFGYPTGNQPLIGHLGTAAFNGGVNNWYVANIACKQTASTFTTLGCFSGPATSFYNVDLDQAGLDSSLIGVGLSGSGNNGGSVIYSRIRNSGSGAAGTKPVVVMFHGGGLIYGTTFGPNLRGTALLYQGVLGMVHLSLFTGNKSIAIQDNETDATRPIPQGIHNVTIDNSASNDHAIDLGAIALMNDTIFNNIIYGVTTALKYGVNFADSYQTNVQKVKYFFGRNDYFGNSGGGNISGSPVAWTLNPSLYSTALNGDLTSDPGFVNSAGGNYATGANVARQSMLVNWRLPNASVSQPALGAAW